MNKIVKIVISIVLVVIFILVAIDLCSEYEEPKKTGFDAIVDSLLVPELEKTESVKPAAPAFDSVAFASAVADSVAKAVVQKESAFLALLREHVTKSTLNVRKKPKAPERQNFYPHYEDDLRTCARWDWEYEPFEEPYPYPLYGRVKSVESDDGYGEEYLAFNTHGDLSSCSIPCSDSTDPNTELYEYNANNVLVGVYVYLYRLWEEWGPKEYKSPVYEAKKFDSRGNIIELDFFNGSLMWCSKQGTNKMKYNAKGEIIEQSEFDAEGNKTGKTTWKYNSKGTAIESVGYDAEGNETGKSAWKYNSKGKVLEVVEYDAEGNETGKSTWKYNSKGDIIEAPASEIGGDYGISKITCKYDKRGNRVEFAGYDNSDSLVLKKRWYYSKDGILVLAEKYDSTGSLAKVALYSYDKRGNVAEIQVYNAAGELKKKRSFKYDRMGNVIEMRVSPSYWDREEDVFKYKITYYK